MLSTIAVIFTLLAASTALPIPAALVRRQVTELDPEATAEAQQRDDTATRAFTASQITTSSGQCLFVDPLSGDFRENLTPVQVVDCDASSDGQKWDLITSGKHQDAAGQSLVVSSKTNACLNFDPRRPAGNQVLLFSCGGRADGGGEVTNSQQFAFQDGQAKIPLIPANQENTCLTVNEGTGLLDVDTNCNTANAETFTFGASGATPASGGGDDAPPAAPTSSSSSSAPASTCTCAPGNKKRQATLDPEATAEAQQKDDSATRAFTSSQITTSSGQCLSVDPLSGDFRENLTPVQLVDCDASADGQKWDVITSGKHQDTEGQALVVSSLTNACLNFDPRRAAGNQVLLFSCGGRADGGGEVTNSQQFAFQDGQATIPFVPANQANTCLVSNAGTGVLDVDANCDTANAETFTFGAAGSGSAPAAPPASGGDDGCTCA